MGQIDIEGGLQDAWHAVATIVPKLLAVPWIFGRKVVLPAATIETIDLDNRAVVVSLTKDQIKDSPDFDPDRYDDEYRNRLAKYYEQHTSC